MLSTGPEIKRFLNYLFNAGFFIAGIATVLIGQILPILSQKFSLSDEQAAYFFPAQFTGSVIGTLLTGWFGKKNKFLPASFIGCGLMGTGVLLLNLDYQICLAGFFINGLGIGLTLPSMNILIVELNPKRAVTALSILNFFWGFGAIISQPFVDFLSDGTSIFWPTLILAITLFFISAALIPVPRDFERDQASETADPADRSTPIWTNPIAWGIALFNFIHLGIESSLGGWLKTYTERIEGTDYFSLFPPIFLYFLFFVLGRGVAPIFYRFLSVSKMLLWGLFQILTGVIVLLYANDIFLLSVGACLTGFGTSSIFPTNVSRFTQTFGSSSGRRAMPFFISGTIGAGFTTWLVGFVSGLYGNNLRVGLFLLLAGAVFLIFLQIALSLKKS